MKNLLGRVGMKGLATLAAVQRTAAPQAILATAPQFPDPIMLKHRPQRHTSLDGSELNPPCPAASGRLRPPPQLRALVLLQQFHVQVAGGLDPVLMDLHRQRPHQPQATGRVRKDPHD